MVHGLEAAEQAAETARKTFEEGASAEGLPTYTVKAPIGILTAVVEAGLAQSNGEVRRAIKNNAISLNDERINDPNYMLSSNDMHDGVAKLSFGKKKHALLKLE